MLTYDSKIIIVGGGVFGLTTALWLARSGYHSVTIFDRCQFDENYYNPADGCDGASSDLNKVFRMAYGDRLDYQNLAIEARDMWLDWNKQIKDSRPDQLPGGLTPDDELLLITGSCFLSEGERLHEYYETSLSTMERTAPEFRRMQFVKDNFEDESRLGEIGDRWLVKLHALDKINHGNVNGFMDIQAGIMLADKGYGMPITKDGRIKFGFRGRKFTNFEDHPTEPDLRISTPRTKYTDKPIETVPLYGLSLIKEQLNMAFPELREFGFQESRLCWYTDSIDNDYVIDYVPGYSNSLFISTGGSGHAFKFLPILGRHVKNQIEREVDQFTPLWKWRVAQDGQDNNGLSDGATSFRNLINVEMADEEDFKWTSMGDPSNRFL
ncbi:hypothetical protein E8E14_007986 [Neopestalotiopsis sp. 37M]|nr:hypothetical protein E8E14_007986 [Neopestalotiopsis sp. 37M]